MFRPTPSMVVMVANVQYAGGELFNYIVENGRLPEGEARRFFQQMLLVPPFLCFPPLFPSRSFSFWAELTYHSSNAFIILHVNFE
jgi:hypothetical protein